LSIYKEIKENNGHNKIIRKQSDILDKELVYH